MSSMSNRVVGGIMSGFASALLVAAAVPAQGADRNETAVAPTPAPDASSAAPAAKRVAKTYCIVEALTGSRVPTKVCKTKAEWAADGLDVTEK